MPMQLSRRHFLWLAGAAASLPVKRVAAQRARGGSNVDERRLREAGVC
jgi:hypothetical protein